MKFTSITAVLNSEDWIDGFLQHLKPFDKRIVVISDYDYNGKPVKNNPKTEKIAKKYANVYHGKWKNQEDRKNFAIEKSDADWIANIDIDMFFTQKAQENMMAWIKDNSQETAVWFVKLEQYFKSPFAKTVFRKKNIGWYPMFVNVKKGYRYTFPLKCNIKGTDFNSRIPESIAKGYHFSYVRTEEGMKEKLKTFSHSHEVVGNWYERIWKFDGDIKHLGSFGATSPEECKSIELVKIPFEIWDKLPKWCKKEYPYA